MIAYKLQIDAKTKARPFDVVSPSDFATSGKESFNPMMILSDPSYTLYCLDHTNKQILFVKTPPDINLLEAPCYFIAQYEAAEQVIAVPYETLHTLAQSVSVDPHQIIFFYSTGRCGSTLMSHVMNLSESVVSYSEPDVFSQLVKLHTARLCSDDEIVTLLHDTVMVMAMNAHLQGYHYISFKFRSYILSISELLYQAIPSARNLFMYRDALTWAQSFSRAFGTSDEGLKANMEGEVFRYMIPMVNDHLVKNDNKIRWTEYLAYMWLEAMQNGRKLQQRDAMLAQASFEALQENPHAVIRAMLTDCGLPLPSADALEQVLGRDSQSGTMGARNKVEPARSLSDSELAEIAEIIFDNLSVTKLKVISVRNRLF